MILTLLLTLFYFILALLLTLAIVIFLHVKRLLPSFMYTKQFFFFVQILFLGNFFFITSYYEIFSQFLSIILVSGTPSLFYLENYYIDNKMEIKDLDLDLNKLINVLFSTQNNGSSSTSTGNNSTSTGNINASNQQAVSTRNSSSSASTTSSSSPERIGRRSSPILDQLSRRNSPILDQLSGRTSPSPEPRGRRTSLSPELRAVLPERLTSTDSVFTRNRPRVWGLEPGLGNNDISFEQSMERAHMNDAPLVSEDTSSRIPNPLFQGVNNYGVVSQRDKELVAALVFRGAFIQNSIWHVDQIYDPTHVQQRFLNSVQSDSLQPFANNLADFLQHHTSGTHQETRFGYPSIHPITSLWLVHYHANNFPQVFTSDEWINIRHTDRILPSSMVNRSEEQIIADWGRPVVLFNVNTKILIIEALRNER